MRRLLCIIITCFLAICSGSAQTKKFVVQNPIDTERSDELVVLKKNEIENKLGPIAMGKFISILDKNNRTVLVQFDDLNGDNKWDEVAFLYSFKSKETAEFTIRIADENSSVDSAKRAHVRLRKKNPDDSFGPIITKETMPAQNPPTDFSKVHLPGYLTEGPAWENDKVAFRQYFDVRNARDIYGKTTSKMMMDTIGANYKNSYHELSSWGMDIFHVEKSLGAGSVAVKTKDKNGKDTLIRLGGKDIKKETYEAISDGPVRAIFKINYDWIINDNPVQVTDITSIWGGQYFYESKLILKDAPANSELIAGIANFFDNTTESFESPEDAVFLSHGKQSENKDFLGLAIITGKKEFAAFGKTPAAGSDILNTYFVAQRIQNNQPLSYRFFSCWEKTDHRFVSMEYFKKYMKDEARKFSHPVQVKW